MITNTHRARKGGRHDGEEVAGDDRMGVVPDESQPSLLEIGRSHRAANLQVLLYRARRNSDTEFQSQLVGDAFLASGHVLDCHLPDQLPQVLWQTRSSGRLRLPAPEQPESFAMPTDEVSAWTCTRAPRHGNMRLSVAFIQRVESLARRGLTLRSWKSASCLRRNRFSAARARREYAATKARRTRSTATDEIVRNECTTVRINGKPGMNAQDDTLQNVTGLQFEFVSTSAEHRSSSPLRTRCSVMTWPRTQFWRMTNCYEGESASTFSNGRAVQQPMHGVAGEKVAVKSGEHAP